MEENTFIKKKYLRIENDSFGFVTNEIHEILESDIEISEEEYNAFFNLQTQGKQFRLKEVSTGKELFDYLEEYEPITDTTPQPPSETEKLRADVDYLAIVTGVEL